MCVLKFDINIIHMTDNMLNDKTFKWLPQHTHLWRQFENERVRKSFRALTDTSWTIPTLIDRVKFWIVSLGLFRFSLKKSPPSPLLFPVLFCGPCNFDIGLGLSMSIWRGDYREKTLACRTIVITRVSNLSWANCSRAGTFDLRFCVGFQDLIRPQSKSN